jgi:hypothetical protein
LIDVLFAVKHIVILISINLGNWRDSMAKIDIYVKIKYDSKVNVKGKDIFIEDTNIKEERLEDFLLDWLLTEVGKGKDGRKVIERESYEVVIGCDLRDDSFYVQSNTGNDGLTCGIVMGMVSNLEEK